MKIEHRMAVQVSVGYLLLYLSAAALYWIFIAATSVNPEVALTFSLFVLALVCPVAAYSYALGAVRVRSGIQKPMGQNARAGHSWGIVVALSVSLSALGICFLWLIQSGEIWVSMVVLFVNLLLSLALINVLSTRRV
jgi:hypothetical protein